MWEAYVMAASAAGAAYAAHQAGKAQESAAPRPGTRIVNSRGEPFIINAMGRPVSDRPGGIVLNERPETNRARARAMWSKK